LCYANGLSEEEKRNIFVLVVGEGDASAISKCGFSFRHCEFMSNNELPDLYRLSDLYVCASIEDSGPTMINQAIMSGTPVVSFEMGVAMDLVVDGISGYIVELCDVKMMADRIRKVLSLDSSALHELSRQCRELALQKCHPMKQMEIYDSIMFPTDY
jgi:glycosyltransferase involved in cell wall biosynthesis